jgi:hypothetical protein
MRNKKIRVAAVIYLLAVAFYFSIALAGNKYYSYVDVDTLELAENKYMGQMVMASIMIGIGFCIWCAKLWPKVYNDIKWSVVRYMLMPLAFIGLSYWWNTGVFRLINAPAKKEMIIKGAVARKFYEGYDNISLRRSRKRKYYVEIDDTATRYVYLFKCRKRAYESIPDIGGYINKKFVVGSLGIIYRKDP